MSNRFERRVTIVTGASSGIGREMALALVREGGRVVACARNEEKLAALAGASKALDGDLLTVPCDVSRSAEVSGMVAAAVQRFGKIDILVNNAGQFPVTPLLDMTEEEWDRIIATNLKGAFLCCQTVAREMIRQGNGGQIVNISSTASLIARPGVAHYASSKAGLNMLTRVLAVELAPHGIRVNAVLPGLIATEAVMGHLDSDAARAEHQTKLARIPLGHEGAPQDIVKSVLHLVSDDAAYTTGTLMVVDGGYTLGIPAYRS